MCGHFADTDRLPQQAKHPARGIKRVLLLIAGAALAWLVIWLAVPGRDATQLQAQRQRFDATVWADEVLAQEYEEPFIHLWDALRTVPSKRLVLGDFPFEQIIFGTPQPPRVGEGSLVTTRLSGKKKVFDRAEWRKLIDELSEQGFRLVQSEWHHARFTPPGDGPARSTVAITLDLANDQQGARYTVKGDLHVEWQPRADAESPPRARVIDARDLIVTKRPGEPLFRERWTVGPEITGKNPRNKALLLVYDLDRNGLSDLIMPANNVRYRNSGGWNFQRDTFLDQPPAALRRGDAWTITTGLLADFTGDGQADFVGAGPDLLFLCQGDEQGRFSQAPAAIGPPQALQQPSIITAGDVDGDGDLDLWVGQYLQPYIDGQMPTPFYDANDGYPGFLLRNDGKGRFADVTEASGLAPKRQRRMYSASFVDLDDDGDLDLITVNDFAGLDVFLGDGRGQFVDVTDSFVDQRHAFGMSHTLADYNLDGKLDLYMIGMSSTTARRLDALGLGRDDAPDRHEMRRPMGYGNRMYLAATGGYRQAAFNDQVARTGWSWGSTSFDFDNDGDRDVYVANGHISRGTCRDYCTRYWTHDIYLGDSEPDPVVEDFINVVVVDEMQQMSWNGYEHNKLLMNHSGRGFSDVGFLVGVGFEFDSRNVVSDDLDNDGRVDLVVVEKSQATGPTLHALQNVHPATRHWIGIRLAEHGAGYSPLGCRVRVRSGETSQPASVVAGDSFRSQHATRVHFGLGTREHVEEIEVRWQNGEISRLPEPAVDRYHDILPPGAASQPSVVSRDR